MCVCGFGWVGVCVGGWVSATKRVPYISWIPRTGRAVFDRCIISRLEGLERWFMYLDFPNSQRTHTFCADVSVMSYYNSRIRWYHQQ
jgi:hypothetical protein